MPRVELTRASSRASPATGDLQAALDAPDGAQLVDLCDEARAPVSFSCRGATCGTCLVHVVQGRELLEEPGAIEKAFLAELGLDDSHRLACQTEIRAGDGLIRLQCIGPERSDPEVE